jgi:hypothetical protein
VVREARSLPIIIINIIIININIIINIICQSLLLLLPCCFCADRPLQLGRLLLSCVERFALETCKVKQAWMPALNNVAKPSTGLSLLPTWDWQPGLRKQLQLAQACSVNILGLSTALAAAGSSEGGSSSSNHTPKEQQQEQQQQQQQQQQQSLCHKDAQTCWGNHLKYGPAPSVADWMQLPKHLLLRYSYVPFIMKRLSGDTLLPLPKFESKILPRPAAAHSEDPAEAEAAAEEDEEEEEEDAAPDVGTQARQVLLEAFPASGYLRRQSLRQNVRQPQQLRKRRRWHEEFDDSEETEEEEEDISEDDDDDDDEQDEDDDSKGRWKHRQQQQNLRPPSQRQQFQEQVRQQFLARQQAFQRSQQFQQR